MVITSPSAPTRQHDVAVLLALLGACSWPVVAVARSAAWKSPVGEVVASSSLPVLLVIAAVAVLARRAYATSAGRSPIVRVAVAALPAVAPVLLAGLWSLADGTSFPDPAGVGLLAPPGSPTWLALGAAAAAVAAGLLASHLAARARRSPLAIALCTAFLALAGAVLAKGSPAGALSVSAVSAVLVTASVAALAAPPATPGAPTQPASAPVLRLGAAAGLVALTSGCLHLFAAHTPERAYTVGSRVLTLGPVLPLMMWVALFSAAVGIGAAAVTRLIHVAISTRRVSSVARALTFRQIAVVLLTTAIAIRIGAILTINNAPRDAADPYFYHVTANLLAHGRGFWEPLTWVASGADAASALHGPALPAALSFWSRLGGTGYFDHQMACIVLGVPQVGAVMLLARLLAGRRAAIVAGVLAAVYPNIWVADGILFVEGLMAVFTTLATWLAYRWRLHPDRRTIAAVGALVALAALTRGEAVLLVPLLVVPLVFTARQLTRGERWRHVALGVGAFAAVLAPWMIYNSTRFEVLVPLSTNSNEVLFYANCEDVYSGTFIGFWSFDCQTRYRAEHGEPAGDEAERAVFWRQRAIDFTKDHLGSVPKVLAARLGRQWELFRPSQTLDFAWVESRPREAVAAGQGMYYVMMLAAIPATLSLRRRRTAVWPLWIHALAVSITAAYAYGTLRFRAPFEPILCVLAAIGVVHLFDNALPWWRHQRASRGAPRAQPS